MVQLGSRPDASRSNTCPTVNQHATRRTRPRGDHGLVDKGQSWQAFRPPSSAEEASRRHFAAVHVCFAACLQPRITSPAGAAGSTRTRYCKRFYGNMPSAIFVLK